MIARESRSGTRHPALLAFFGALVVAGCSSSPNEPECTPDASYDPVVVPAAFEATVTNPLFPLVPGTKFTYTGSNETIEVTVLPGKKLILGVSCTIVHDVVKEDGEVIEDTFDWFAQDTSGAVWYFGEDTKELEGGQVVSTEGSWEAGVDGAKAGMIIPANPTVGLQFRQEYYPCVAEDMGEILGLNATASVPHGSHVGCLQTRDFTPLEPDVNEHKYYCPGVGLVLIVAVGSGDREELISIQGP